MYLTPLILSSVLTLTHASLTPNIITARDTNNTEEAYLNSVCYPATTDPIPPCQEIINIQTICTPNTTTPLGLLAHAQCMCGGSFFADWVGCLSCEYVHGGRTQQEVGTFENILDAVESQLCTGTPTADFADLFASVSADGTGVQGTGATVKSDQFPSETAVSLYFTASGSQGPGAITGSATGATAVVTGQATTLGGDSKPSSTPSVTGTGASGSKTTAASAAKGSSTSTSSSTGGAAPTGVAIAMLGMAMLPLLG